MTLQKNMAVTLNTVINRSLEDQIAERGTVAPIDIYPDDQDDTLWDTITSNAEAAGDQIYDEVFMEQRKQVSRLIYDTIQDIATVDLGNADLALDISVSDEDIDEVMMMMLDPQYAGMKEEVQQKVEPNQQIEEGDNG